MKVFRWREGARKELPLTDDDEMFKMNISESVVLRHCGSLETCALRFGGLVGAVKWSVKW